MTDIEVATEDRVPIAMRFPAELHNKVRDYAAIAGVTRHQAIIELVTLGLEDAPRARVLKRKELADKRAESALEALRERVRRALE